MRSFRQIISEQLPSDKLDKLTHNIPLSKKRLKKLAGDYSAFGDFDFDSWQSYPFPSNSSKIVIHETTTEEVAEIPTPLAPFFV